MMQVVNWIIFAGGLFIGLCCGVIYMGLMTQATINDLREENRILNNLNSSENESTSKYEEALDGLTEDEMITLNEMIEGKD